MKVNLQGWILNIIWMKRNKSKWKDYCKPFSLKPKFTKEKRKIQNYHPTFFSFHLYLILSSHNFHTFQRLCISIFIPFRYKKVKHKSTFCTHDINWCRRAKYNHDLIHMVIFYMIQTLSRGAQNLVTQNNYAIKIQLQVHHLFEKQKAGSLNELNVLGGD